MLNSASLHRFSESTGVAVAAAKIASSCSDKDLSTADQRPFALDAIEDLSDVSLKHHTQLGRQYLPP